MQRDIVQSRTGVLNQSKQPNSCCDDVSSSLRARERRTYVEPIDGAAVDERGEAPQSVAERVTDGTHGEADVQVRLDALDEVVVHRQRRRVDLLALEQSTTAHRTAVT